MTDPIKDVLPRTQRKAFDLIQQAGDDGILIEALSFELYGPVIGLQEGKTHATRVKVCDMRKRLKPCGISIPFGTVSGRYRIEVSA